MLTTRPGRWRRVASVGLGVPLLLGGKGAAAAGSVGAIGGFTTGIGVLAALWAVLRPEPDGGAGGTTWLGGAVALMLVSGLWGWRHQRGRVGATARSAMPRPKASPALANVGGCPEQLDRQQVLEAARSRFLRLQSAWDAGDVAALTRLTTPDMLAQLLPVLDARREGPNRTDVITLHAELLVVEEVEAAYLASVEFSGLIRESAEEDAVPFRELWMLSAGKDGSSSWRLARQQALF